MTKHLSNDEVIWGDSLVYHDRDEDRVAASETWSMETWRLEHGDWNMEIGNMENGDMDQRSA